MRNLFKTTLLVIMVSVATPSFCEVITPTPVENPAEARARELTNRLEEIDAMDKKSLSRAEKKALRGEVKAIKKEMKAISGGVYLSVGAIILIVLLIILLA
jgi:hypothetical protein